MTRGIAEPRKLPPLRVSTLQSPSSSNAQSSKPPVCALTRDHRDLIDRADEIELVDLPPDELLDRLKAGKIYLPDVAARATSASRSACTTACC